MRSPGFDRQRFASASALSLAVHLGVLAIGALLLARSARPLPVLAMRAFVVPVDDDAVEIELPPISEGAVAGTAVELPVWAVPRGGGEAMPRPDTGARGHGGTDTAEAPALNLADRDDRMHLQSEVPSRLDRNQIQRIDGGRTRASHDDWRASREPMELTFLASGKSGSRAERRRWAEHDPSSGARERGRVVREGGALGAEPLPPGIGLPERAVGGAVEGAAQPSAGIGVRDGAAGSDARARAEVPLARPMVPTSTPSVPSDRDGKPQDNQDSEQEVALAMQSIVHASTAGGARGVGPGGEAGAGPTGSGGVRGSGSTAQALGNGQGLGVDRNAADRMRTDYLRRVLARIHPLWRDAFPKWAIAEGLGGTVIVSFVISANGSVASARVTRPSGIPEFDENCRQAVLRGAPFDPLPPELGTSFSWSMPFVAKNPAVRPQNPGSP